MRRSGIYGDIVIRGNDVHVVYMNAGYVVYELNGNVIWKVDVSEYNHLMFLNCCLDLTNNKMYAAGKANTSGFSVIVTELSSVLIPYGYGNYSCQLAFDDSTGEVVCYAMMSGAWYGKFDLDGNLINSYNVPPQYVGTSQGIRFVNNSGTVFFGDETFVGTFDGVVIHEWMFRQGFTCGQGHETGSPVVGTGVKFSAFSGQSCFFPRLSVDGNKIGVLRVNRSVIEWQVFTPPYPTKIDPNESASPVLNPPPVIDPVIPIDPVGPSMKLSPEILQLRDRFALKFPIPQWPGGGDAHEERCRQWSIKFDEQVVFTFPNQGYGTKRADSNRPISKDSLARQVGDSLFSWDLLDGAGTGTPTLSSNPDGKDITGQIFVPLTGKNHLLGIVDPVLDPIPGDRHRYNGGGNDTGICDTCGRNRNSTVHNIPEANVKHVYDGGEQDTGQCDICGKGRQDSIHRSFNSPIDPPVDPPVDPVKPVDPPVVTTKTYEEMFAMLDKANKAYRRGSWGGLDLPMGSTAHLVWRFLIENYSVESLVEDARKRGKGENPD